MKIGDMDVGNGSPCIVISELGINHQGSIKIAKQMIDAAVGAGCSMVKFQKRSVNLCYSEEELSRPRESPFGSTNGDLKRGLEFGFDEYCQIDEYCKKKNIQWHASPWDIESVKFLEQFDVPCYKVASACLTDKELLFAIQATRKPVIISTGMSSGVQIATAASAFNFENIALLVCTSTYPSALKDLRLERLHTMKTHYPDIPIGWSHHAVSPWMALCAAAMGANIIEAHITLDRTSYGSDQAASLEPEGKSVV